jgi:hypothetical protein
MGRRTSAAAIALLVPAAAYCETAPAGEGPWWTGHLIAAIAAILGALMIVWQIGRQRRNEIASQLENFKIGLRLQVYQEFSARLSSASTALGSAGMYAFCGPRHMEMTFLGPTRGQPSAIADRAKTFLDLDSTAQREIADTIILLEKYLLIHPDMDVLRMALSSVAHDMREAFHPLFAFMLEHFPIDGPSPTGPQTLNVKAFTRQQVEQAHPLAMSYYSAATDAQSYVTDIQTELQFIFLGDLFPNRPIRRSPADPAKRVLSLDPAAVKSLRQHFLRNTAWGKTAVDTSFKVHEHFHGRI